MEPAARGSSISEFPGAFSMFKNLSPSALGITGHQSELIELALSFGFEAMELNVVDLATRAKLKGMDYARRLIVSARLKMGAFSLPLNWEADEATFQKELKKLPEYAEAAVAVGCTGCLAILAPGSDQLPYHENFEFHRRRLSEVCKALEPAGIRLGLGFQAAEYLRKNQAFQFIHDLDALTLLMNMVAAPNVGLLLDIWDVFASGGSLDSVRKLPPAQIVAVQVAEMQEGIPLGELDERSRLLPGAEGGRIDLAAFLTILKEAAYQGPVTPKPSRSAFTSRRRDLVVRQTGEALDKVWRAAGLTTERRLAAYAASRDG
jgi:sugar phosphate isomerase/epimerase